MELHRRYAPTETPKGTVLLAHGYAEHSGRFTHFHDTLVDAGYDVVFYDHAGHGTNDGPRAQVDVGRLIEDHLHARHMTLAHARTDSIFLFGHSMGGVIAGASTLLNPSRLRGTVLTGPAFRPLPAVPAHIARALLPVARLFPGLIAAPVDNSEEGSKLSRNPSVQRAFNADPLTHKGGVPLLTGATMIVQGDEVIAHAHTLKVPMLIIHGDADQMASIGGSRRFVSQALTAHPLADLQLRVIPGAYHEVLNEPEGPHVMSEIVDWLDRR